MTKRAKETWESGEAYEQYVGRWSRLVATEFLGGLDVEPGSTWGDVGCGTGRVLLHLAQEGRLLPAPVHRGYLQPVREHLLDDLRLLRDLLRHGAMRRSLRRHASSLPAPAAAEATIHAS